MGSDWKNRSISAGVRGSEQEGYCWTESLSSSHWLIVLPVTIIE